MCIPSVDYDIYILFTVGYNLLMLIVAYVYIFMHKIFILIVHKNLYLLDLIKSSNHLLM